MKCAKFCLMILALILMMTVATRWQLKQLNTSVGISPVFFFRNGALKRLENAIYHHLHVFEPARSYEPMRAGVAKDLTLRLGPIEAVLARLDPVLLNPPYLTSEDCENPVTFVRTGLLDERARRQNLCALIPAALPSGMPPLQFEECPVR